MKKRFSARAQTSILKAQDLSREYGHDSVAPTAMLSAIISLEEGIAWNLMSFLSIDIGRIKARIDREFQNSPSRALSGEVSASNDLNPILEQAAIIAASMDSEFIGTEHLLLALCRSNDRLATSILFDAGATEAAVRGAIYDLTDAPAPPDLPKVPVGVRSKRPAKSPLSDCPSILGFVSMCFPNSAGKEVEGVLVFVRPGEDPNTAFSELMRAIPDLAGTKLRFKLPGEKPIEKAPSGWTTIDSEPERFFY